MTRASIRAGRTQGQPCDQRLRDLKCLLRKGELRIHLQAAGGESLDAEDLLVRQVELSGRSRRPVYSIKHFRHTGGTVVLRGAMEKQVRQQLAALLADYTLSDAVPVQLEFPLPAAAGSPGQSEWRFALLLIGPRLKRGVGK